MENHYIVGTVVINGDLSKCVQPVYPEGWQQKGWQSGLGHHDAASCSSRQQRRHPPPGASTFLHGRVTRVAPTD